MEKIAIYSGSFNPPCIHHMEIINFILNYFDKIIVVPCGIKEGKTFPEPIHRLNMISMAFKSNSKCILDLSNIEENKFTSNYELEKKYSHLGDIYHVIGDDVVEGRKECILLKKWEEGEWVWQNSKFIIIQRNMELFCLSELPKNCSIIARKFYGSSSLVRYGFKNNIETKDLILPVKSYIIANKLYI